MRRIFLCLFGLLLLSNFSISQISNNKVLFILDSIPLLTDPEDWNQLLVDDISDRKVVILKDSLDLLGYGMYDGLTYIFTKEYRQRPDSIKKIPSLRQMNLENGVWNLGGLPYSGKYIDYYNNGKKQNEGTLLDGKIAGELTVYYKNGIKKSITNYKNGIRHGTWADYYQNGVLMQSYEFTNGKSSRNGKIYFINGQIKHELKLKKTTSYDTSIVYYSSGKVRNIKVTKTGTFHRTRKEANWSYYTTMFYEHLRTRDIKSANKNLYEIMLIDSTNIDTYFMEGILLVKEFRFNEAILRFDKALAMEPLMREALEQRGLSRLKMYKSSNVNIAFQNRKEIPLVLEDIVLLSEHEKVKVCTDLLLADQLDPGVKYNNKSVPEVILQYCKQRSR